MKEGEQCDHRTDWSLPGAPVPTPGAHPLALTESYPWVFSVPDVILFLSLKVTSPVIPAPCTEVSLLGEPGVLVPLKQ